MGLNNQPLLDGKSEKGVFIGHVTFSQPNIPVAGEPTGRDLGLENKRKPCPKSDPPLNVPSRRRVSAGNGGVDASTTKAGLHRVQKDDVQEVNEDSVSGRRP